MFVCSELIEETGRSPGLILACWDISSITLTLELVRINFSHIRRSYDVIVTFLKV